MRVRACPVIWSHPPGAGAQVVVPRAWGHRAHAEWSGPTRLGWMGQGGVPEGGSPSLSPPIPNQGGVVDVCVYTSLGFPREARGFEYARGDAPGRQRRP